MLKNRKLKHKEFISIKDGKVIKRLGDDVYGYISIEGLTDALDAPIKDKNIIKEINSDEYFLAQVSTSIVDSDYHTFSEEYFFNGLFLAFNLNMLDTTKYFGKDLSPELLDFNELIKQISNLLKLYNIDYQDIKCEERGYLKITIPDKELNDDIVKLSDMILHIISDYYSNNDIHITRMFGSFILLKKMNNELKAIKATPIPIKYCPLMINLLKEVGGNTALSLINSLQNSDQKLQQELMCKLINEVVIKGGYFDTNRPLNSCEANVLFGASETISSAFKTNMIDASVIVSNNLGTIITTNESNTQGAVKRMTGLFYTSPSEKLVNTAFDAGIIPVFPYTAEIDQLEGLKKAISMGYTKIAITLACMDNILLESISKLEQEFNVTIYKFGLCSTGIDYETAIIMRDYADVIWSCASKYVKEIIEPCAIAQVGVKIPVHIMTKKGWDIVRNHIISMDNTIGEITLTTGDDKPVLINNNGTIVKEKKKYLRKCSDCPHPCV